MLGGDDIDRKLLEIYFPLLAEQGIDLNNIVYGSVRYAILDEIRKMKESLSTLVRSIGGGVRCYLV